MKRTIKNHCLNPTNSKLTELYEIGKRCARVKNHIFQKYGSLSGLQYLSYPRAIRDGWVAAGHADAFKLQARQWKQAFDEAFANIRTNWSNASLKVKQNLYRNSAFTEDEKHYAFYLLKAPNLLYAAVTFKTFDLPEKFQGMDIRCKRIHKYLKSRLRKHLGKKPCQRKNRSFQVDAEMYDFHTDSQGHLWIGIMGLTPRKRIRLLMTSSVIPKGNLRVVLNGNRVEIHSAEDITVNPLCGTQERALDKGFTEVITSSSGKKYGEGFGKLLIKESDRLSEKNKKRNKLRALAKKYEKKGDIIKAETIRKFNLGKKKYAHQKEVNNNDIKRCVNTALNDFFEEEMPAVIGAEDLTFANWSRKLPKRVKRYFSSWLKGYLQERLDFKTMLNGVQQVVVNAAYGSQVCYLCGCFGIRRGDKFYCETHGELDADHNAALNYLNRMHDPDITRYTPYRKVRDILEARGRLSTHDFRYSVLQGQSKSERTGDVLIHFQ